MSIRSCNEYFALNLVNYDFCILLDYFLFKRADPFFHKAFTDVIYLCYKSCIVYFKEDMVGAEDIVTMWVVLHNPETNLSSQAGSGRPEPWLV